MIRTHETANKWAQRYNPTMGHIYHQVLRCDLCDYVSDVTHMGPNYDRGKWEIHYCPNVIAHPGLRPRLMPSLK